MLAALRIQNLALVEDLSWEPGPGLIAVTGETGAGKSVIVGAVKLVLGDRADKTLIRTGHETCMVDALFQLNDAEEIDKTLTQAGFEPCEDGELHVRRTISTSGPNRQFVNGSPVPLNLLKELGDRLVDLHGAHDHHSLLSRDRQLELLNKFGVPPESIARYQDAFQHWADSRKELRAFENDVVLSDSERDLLRHQADEIEAAALLPGEDEALRKKFALVSQQRRFFDTTATISHLLNDDPGGLYVGFHALQRAAADLERIDPSLTDALETISQSREALEGLESTLETRRRDLETDPAQAADLEARLDLIENLRRKYGGGVEEIIAKGEAAAKRLAAAENRGTEREKLSAKVDAARKGVDSAARKLHDLRLKAAPKLAHAVASHFKDLGFQRAIFEIALEDLPEPNASGADSVDFLFSPNLGEPAKPLRIIASSGEMARVMLAVKCALAAHDNIPLLIFDEIDANVGGTVAEAVGDKMRSLADGQQVIAITHLPQVASRGDSHFLVVKDFSNGRTRSLLKEISEEDRLEELARMLGGARESALSHAGSLLGLKRAESKKS